jgi:HSP20 family protein
MHDIIALPLQQVGCMDRDVARNWMWSEACEMLARAERLHREFFRPIHSASGLANWEPPVDILETEREVLVFVALPGVSADRVEMAIEGSELVVAGIRTLPSELQTAVIHRLELPQGRFERRVRLPTGAYSSIRRSTVDGCLLIALRRADEFGG